MATTLANISIKDSSSWNTYLNLIYPVGSYYISNSSTSPATRFGGTWTQITGRVLYCNTSVGNYDAGSHTHALSNGYAELDFGDTGAYELAWRRKTSSASFSSSYSGTYAYAVGITSGREGTSKDGRGAKTALGGNSNSATNGLPARRDVFCWYRTA